MFDAAKLLTFYAETAVHPGSGGTLGAIDLPIQREKHTGFPVLPSTSIKGVLRDEGEITAGNDTKKQHEVTEIFGPDVKKRSTPGSGSSAPNTTARIDEHGGAISPTEGRLLLFPVRSLKGIFVWATCPFAVNRLARDLEMSGLKSISVPTGLSVGDASVLVSDPSDLGNDVVLEEDEYTVASEPRVETLVSAVQQMLGGPAVAASPGTRTPPPDAYMPIRSALATRLIVTSDTDFARLVMHATEVVTRNRLNEQKTTTGGVGNMWQQEYVPSDAFFYSIVLAMPSRRAQATLTDGKAILNALTTLVDKPHLQIGGDESVGRGWMRIRWV